MKVRKLAVALALAGGLGSGVAQALGLGEIELQSYLNQPLNAEIDVRRAGGVSPDDIIVNLASEQAYERVGLSRDHFLTRLDFNVGTSANGELVITVTSREPVREPYLNFLVEVSWPSGRVMREYSLLVDPPVYGEDASGDEPVQSTRSGQRSSQPQPSADRQPRQQSETTSSRSSGSARTLGPTGSSDTLWKIAERVRPDSSVSVQQVMLALQDLNPDAFINGNINRLKRGEVLRVPDMDDIRARSQAQANQEVTAQNNALAQSQPQREVDATEDAPADAGTGSQQAGADSDELRLVVPEDGDEDAREQGSAGGDGQQGGSADAGRALALEELDRVERENEELNSRLQDMQDQVETLQRLIELKDSQLAEIQNAAGADGEGAGEAGDGAPMSADGEGEQDSELAPVPIPEVEDGQETGTPADEDELEAGEEGLAGEAGDEGFSEADEPAPATEPEQVADDPVAVTGGEPAEPSAQPEQPAEAEKGFLARAIDLIAGNFLYQIALGGFLLLLLLLVLLISRRRANNENEFYQQLDDDHGDDGFELDLGEERPGESNVLEEADRYISYGQHDAAADVLESAISREPSRSDLRLKLLAVYADTGNRAAFDKQYAELDAMELDEAMPEAEALRARLEDVESTPSIDELESQLRGDTGGGRGSPELMQDEYEAARPETPEEEATNDLMASFDELDLPDDNDTEQDKAADPDASIDYDISTLGTEDDELASVDSELSGDTRNDPEVDEDALGSIDFELPDEELQEGELTDSEQRPLEPEEDFTSLELDEAGFDSKPASEDIHGAGDTEEEMEFLGVDDSELDTDELELSDSSVNPEDEADLDESFLDELDAELDRVASEEDSPETGTTNREDGLDDLELDVTDEDLALMDQVSESEPEDESRLDLDDLELDDDQGPAQATTDDSVDDLSDLEIPELESDDMRREPGDVDGPEARSGIDGIDEAELGEDDDFDFLSGTDEVATKLDLARAYVDMGDSEGAREILEEVILEGTDQQKGEAQSLLKKLP